VRIQVYSVSLCFTNT